MELSSSSLIVLSVDEFGRTALMWASKEGDAERVRQLLDMGAPVNAKDMFGRTALMEASLYGHTKIVQLLLGNGDDIVRKEPCTALKGGAGRRGTKRGDVERGGVV